MTKASARTIFYAGAQYPDPSITSGDGFSLTRMEIASRFEAWWRDYQRSTRRSR